MELPPASEFACVFPARLITWSTHFWQSPHWGICVLQNYCIWVRNTASHVCFCFGCQCRPLRRINRITLMAVAPSGEYQSSLYLSLTVKRCRPTIKPDLPKRRKQYKCFMSIVSRHWVCSIFHPERKFSPWHQFSVSAKHCLNALESY